MMNISMNTNHAMSEFDYDNSCKSNIGQLNSLGRNNVLSVYAEPVV